MLQKLKSKGLAIVKANGHIILGLLILGLFFGRGCQCNKVPGTKVDASEVAALKKSLQEKDNTIIVLRKSLRDSTERHQRQIDSLAKLRAASADRARKSAERASYWQGVAKQADEAKDWETGIAARDSALAEKDVALGELKIQLAYADSSFTKVSRDLDMATLVIERQAEFSNEQKLLITQLQKDLADSQKEGNDLRKKLKRKNFWGKTWTGLKVGIGAAAGFVVGRTVK